MTNEELIECICHYIDSIAQSDISTFENAIKGIRDMVTFPAVSTALESRVDEHHKAISTFANTIKTELRDPNFLKSLEQAKKDSE